MKKVIFGLLLLAGGVLFIINYLGVITSDATDKVKSNALSELIVTGNKPTQNQPATNAKTAEDKSITEQVVMPLMKPLMDDIREITNKHSPQIENPTKNNTPAKSPIATIKIYDKKTNQEISIQTQTMLNAQQQASTPEQKEAQKIKDEKFKAYYHKSKKCLSPGDNEIRVACGNEYIRAKARFEELYRQGKI